MALPAPFTHRFNVQFGTGGQFIQGLIEFNADGKVSYSLNESSIPLDNGVLRDFTELTELLKRIFHSHGGIKLIKFADKSDE